MVEKEEVGVINSSVHLGPVVKPRDDSGRMIIPGGVVQVKEIKNPAGRDFFCSSIIYWIPTRNWSPQAATFWPPMVHLMSSKPFSIWFFLTTLLVIKPPAVPKTTPAIESDARRAVLNLPSAFFHTLIFPLNFL